LLNELADGLLAKLLVANRVTAAGDLVISVGQVLLCAVKTHAIPSSFFTFDVILRICVRVSLFITLASYAI
jgi:hypothetical protein